MGEVHTLPLRSRRPGQEAEARRERAEAVRRLIAESPGSLPGTHAHAEHAARELFRMLEEGGRDLKRRVCEIAFPGVRVPTKRLWGVLIDPKKPRDKVKLAAAKRQRLTIYLKLAEAFASASGQEDTDVILRVFPDIVPDADAIPPSQGDSLQDALRDEVWSSWMRANDIIIEDCDLRRALAIAMEVPKGGSGLIPRFRLDPLQILGDEGCVELRAEMPSNSAYLMTSAPRDFVSGVVPRLFLGESQGPTFRGSVAPLAPDGTVGGALTEFGVWLRLWVRFWWALLPIGPDGDARGCFLASIVTQRAASPVPIGELPACGSEEAAPAGPWPALLGTERDSGRGDDAWLDREYWRLSNVPGVVLSWDMDPYFPVTDLDHAGPFRCTARLDRASRRIIRGVFGCEVEGLPEDPLRILPASSQWRDVIFGLPDGAMAGWVGPDPDRYGFPAPPEPEWTEGMTDAAWDAAHDAYSEALSAWEGQEIDYQRNGPERRQHSREEAQVRA